MEKTCIVKYCREMTKLIMCEPHLNNPQQDGFELKKNVKVNPPPSICSKSPQLKLASALLSISPKNLTNRSSRCRKRLNQQIEDSLELNDEDMIVFELEQNVVDIKQGMFYSADNVDDNCLSSTEFREFSPIINKDQLIICSQTRGVGQKLVPSY
jgi:hypothetical protein